MTNLEEIDRIANIWNKTKDEKYRALWYKKIREWSYGKNIDSINSVVRWNVSKREV